VVLVAATPPSPAAARLPSPLPSRPKLAALAEPTYQSAVVPGPISRSAALPGRGAALPGRDATAAGAAAQRVSGRGHVAQPRQRRGLTDSGASDADSYHQVGCTDSSLKLMSGVAAAASVSGPVVGPGTRTARLGSGSGIRGVGTQLVSEEAKLQDLSP
jgi:hypothetical protein